MLVLVTGTDEEAKDYVVGLFVSSVIVACFFLAWIILLVVLKGMGSKRVGWLSGRRQPLPAKPSSSLNQSRNSKNEEATEPDGGKNDGTVTANEELTASEWEDLYQKKKKDELWMKVVMVLACSTVIAMAIIMAQKGVDSLRGSLSYGQTSINYAQGLLEGGNDLVSSMATTLEMFQNDMQALLNSTNKICPNLKKAICWDILDFTTCDDSAGIFPEGTFADLVRVFNTEWKIVDQLESLSTSIDDIASTADNATAQISTFEWVFYVAVVFDLIVGCLAAWMIFITLFGPKLNWCIKCLHNRLLFPFFLLFVVLSFIFAIAFLITSTVLSDTCVNDPNPRFMTIANHFLGGGSEFSQYILQFINYWLSSCEIPPVDLQANHALLNQTQQMLDDFERALFVAALGLGQACGSFDPLVFTIIIERLSQYICGAGRLVWGIWEAFQCQTWMPLYYTIVYSAMCYSGTSGVWTIAASQMLTVFMACIILTFRCVFFDLKIAEANPGESNKSASEKNGQQERNSDVGNDSLQPEDGTGGAVADSGMAIADTTMDFEKSSLVGDNSEHDAGDGEGQAPQFVASTTSARHLC